MPSALGASTALADALIAAASHLGVGLSLTVFEEDGPRRLVVNDAAAAILGYTVDELLRKPGLDTIAPEDHPRLREVLMRRGTGNAPPETLELTAVRKDGGRVVLEMGISSVQLEGREATVIFFRDVTERRRTEEAVRASERNLRHIFEAAPDLIGVFRGTAFIYANPALLRGLGIPRLEDLLGRDVRDFVHPDDHRIFDSQRSELNHTGSFALQELRFLTSDGRLVILEGTPIAMEFEGEPAVLVVARDVTERSRLQAQLVLADRLATIGLLAAGVAHEINNPLSYVLLNLAVFARELPRLLHDPQRIDVFQQRLVETREGVERVASIVRDLSALARDDRGSEGAVDLRRILGAALKVTVSSVRARLRVVTDLPPLPPVRGSEGRVGQVFLNLILHAAQSSPDDPSAGPSELRLSARVNQDARVVVIDLTHSGAGPSAEHSARLFDPLYGAATPGGRSGIGLAISRSLVDSMGGSLTVEDAPAGTTFRVILPVAPVAGEAPAPPDPARGARRRVLVVDDDPAVARAVADALKEEHDVTVAGTGAEALVLLGHGAFDFVVCDLMMADMTGMEVHDTVERRDPALAARMAFMTGAATVPSVASFLARVANPRLVKPFTADAVRALVRSLARELDRNT